MTKTEWLSQNDPARLILHLRLRTRHLASHRKLRLFGCAALRHIAASMQNSDLVAVCAGVETWCDAPNNRAAVRDSRAAVRLLQRGFVLPPDMWDVCRTYTYPIIPNDVARGARPLFLAVLSSRLLTTTSRSVRERRVSGRIAGQMSRFLIEAAGTTETEVHVQLLHDIFAPPAAAKTSNSLPENGTISNLARAVYEDSRPRDGQLSADRLAILADALEEAGCTDEAILSHCRGQGPHVRGCWVVDLLLGKE